MDIAVVGVGVAQLDAKRELSRSSDRAGGGGADAAPGSQAAAILAGNVLNGDVLQTGCGQGPRSGDHRRHAATPSIASISLAY